MRICSGLENEAIPEPNKQIQQTKSKVVTAFPFVAPLEVEIQLAIA